MEVTCNAPFLRSVTSIEHIGAGEIRALGVTSAARVNVLPDVPVIGEVLPGYEATGWQGIGAPANTPVAIIDRINREVNLALVDPKFTARLVELGGVPFASSPAEFGKFIVEYTEKWARVIRAAKHQGGVSLALADRHSVVSVPRIKPFAMR